MGAAAALAAAPLVGAARWQRTSNRLRAALGESTAGAVFTPEHLAGLPAPVVRYFRRVLAPGQPIARRIDFDQLGRFRIGTSPDSWKPMRATQSVSTQPRGFVWDARISVAPLLPVYVRDSYLGGRGGMRGEVIALFPTVTASGLPELDAGALHRYLAEAVWYPTALLPQEGVEWQGIDDLHATATLTDGCTTVSVQFTFSHSGEIVAFSVPERFREVNGRYEPTPWCGHCGNYQQHGGMWIPVDCEVEWQLPSGPLPYWRARTSNVRYR